MSESTHSEKKQSEKSQSFANYLWGKPGSLRFWLGVAVTTIVVVAVPLTLIAVRNRQDIGSSATGCNQAPIDVQFRKNTEKNPDKPWRSGKDIKVDIGDILEVNCFSKNGSDLLKNGQITGKIDDVAIDLGALSDFFDGVQVRGFDITQAGKYEFKCKNPNGTCKDADSFKVTETSASPSPSPSPTQSPSPSPTQSPSPSPGCSSFAISDLNEDCKSTIQDYDLFLRDFIDQQE